MSTDLRLPQVDPDATPVSLAVPEMITPVDALPDPSLQVDAPAPAKTGGEPASIKCELEPSLQKALQHDPEIQKALMLVPPHVRSVANAITLWDGSWADSVVLGPVAFPSLQAAIVKYIRLAPAHCLAEPVQGPRLIIITLAGRTTLMVIGSGVWKWADLLASSPPPAEGS